MPKKITRIGVGGPVGSGKTAIVEAITPQLLELVINKTDLAPHVGADLGVMDRDSRLMRGDKPFLFTNCKTGEGIPELIHQIRSDMLFDLRLDERATA